MFPGGLTTFWRALRVLTFNLKELIIICYSSPKRPDTLEDLQSVANFNQEQTAMRDDIENSLVSYNQDPTNNDFWINLDRRYLQRR